MKKKYLKKITCQQLVWPPSHNSARALNVESARAELWEGD